MSNFFHIANLTAGYGNDFSIRDINFSINKGCFTGIIGPNGSGKTTLFKTVTGDLECREGQITLNKKNLGKISQKEKAQYLAIVMQNLDKIPLKVEDYVLMGRYPYHKPFQFFETKTDIAIAEKYMELTGISQLKNKNLDQLSGGELQLAAIARALTQEPELLLLDEPTSHLDIKHQVHVLNLIQKLNQTLGLTVMMIIHDLNLASEYCENLILMKNGKLIAQGSPEQVLTYKNIENVYETIVITKTNPVSGKPIVMLVSENSLQRLKHERSFSI